MTLHDGVPVPKVIDFGIAKATEGRLTDRTLFTAFEQFIGTPAYMSPEQAEMSSLDIDTRADIYALGVLLYELLTGKTPFDGRELAQAGIDAMRKTIREVEPQRPSTRLSTLQGAILTTTAQAHGTDSLRLVDLVRGDLDWIVMKCLEKDRTRRYDTANGLAADLKRHLDNEPVVARPPTAAYKFQKAFRRNRLIFTAAGLVLTALATGVAVSLWQAVRANREARRAVQAEAVAQQRLAESEAISKFLTEVFQSPDPARDGRTITVAETLGAAAKKLDTDLATQPARRAALQSTLGQTFATLGLNSEAIAVLEKASGYYVSTVGREHTNAMKVIRYLASSYDRTGRSDEALKLREEVLRFDRHVFGPEHPETLVAMMLVGNSYLSTGRLDDELKLEEEVLPLARKVFGPGNAYTIGAMSNLAGSYSDAGRTNEALEMLRACARDAAEHLGPDAETTLIALGNLGMEEAKSGSLEEAIRLERLALDSTRRVFGPEHMHALSAMSNLANAYRLAHRFGEAIALEEEALPIKRRRLGTGHRYLLESLDILAACYEQVGRQPEAEALRRELAELKAKAGTSTAKADPTKVVPERP